LKFGFGIGHKKSSPKKKKKKKKKNEKRHMHMRVAPIFGGLLLSLADAWSVAELSGAIKVLGGTGYAEPNGDFHGAFGRLADGGLAENPWTANRGGYVFLVISFAWFFFFSFPHLCVCVCAKRRATPGWCLS
jgi:hypothetical protein